MIVEFDSFMDKKVGMMYVENFDDIENRINKFCEEQFKKKELKGYKVIAKNILKCTDNVGYNIFLDLEK